MEKKEARTYKTDIRFSPSEWELLEKMARQSYMPSRMALIRALVIQEAERRGLVSRGHLPLVPKDSKK